MSEDSHVPPPQAPTQGLGHPPQGPGGQRGGPCWFPLSLSMPSRRTRVSRLQAPPVLNAPSQRSARLTLPTAWPTPALQPVPTPRDPVGPGPSRALHVCRDTPRPRASGHVCLPTSELPAGCLPPRGGLSPPSEVGDFARSLPLAPLQGGRKTSFTRLLVPSLSSVPRLVRLPRPLLHSDRLLLVQPVRWGVTAPKEEACSLNLQS